ncbi:MAG: group III truncated hemoglobin [Bacteroidia bacterium]|mgnify:CR=1 FL=1|nr:group III truncated hemoglobin [Bacteroidia bacterium]HQV00934.1 group III truncated hemoglobin [Bacteroidia bacterium]
MDIKTQKSDINNLEDIKIFVNSFYDKVRTDDVLATIFNDVIKDKWPQHLEKMYRFWQTVLLEEHTYFGSPFLPHAKLPVNAAHFERWVKLFSETIDMLFEGEKANRAKWQGDRMATMFLSKIEYYRNNSSIPLI